MFSGSSNVKDILELIEKSEEAKSFVSFELIGNNIYFNISDFNIIKKGNRKHYIVNGKRNLKSYIEKCLKSPFYYLNKKIENIDEFKKLKFFTNIEVVNTKSKSKMYKADTIKLLKDMKDYIKIIENQEKIEDF